MPPQRIVVIGSGFGGLGAAIRLAADGHQVTVVEALDKPGGRAYVFEQDGFRFDAGPTIITAPWMFDELWAKAGRRREDDVAFLKCDPFYRIFDAQHRPFDYNDDEAFILRGIEGRNPADRQGYLDFVDMSRRIFEKGFVDLADQPFLGVGDMLRVAPDLIRLRSYLSVYKLVSGFIADDFLRQVFSFHPLLIGGNPLQAPSIYAMIHYLERRWGVWYAMGGTGALVRAMVGLLRDLGGELLLNAPVERILVEGEGRERRATGVRLGDGRELPADAVVSNADVAHTYGRLVEARHRPVMNDRKLAGMRDAMSLVVIYFGTKRRYAQEGRLAHHNILLGPRYQGLLQDIFHNKGELAQDFSLYLHMPTLVDPSLAPEGHESFYVLSPVPNLGSGIDWERQARGYRDAIMQHLEAHYLPDLQANLVTERFVDPRYFRDRLGARSGSAFSVEPLLRQSAYFRPHNRSEDIANLYLVGAGTHPGAGLPGVLSSAKIAEDLIGAAASVP